MEYMEYMEYITYITCIKYATYKCTLYDVHCNECGVWRMYTAHSHTHTNPHTGTFTSTPTCRRDCELVNTKIPTVNTRRYRRLVGLPDVPASISGTYSSSWLVRRMGVVELTIACHVYYRVNSR